MDGMIEARCPNGDAIIFAIDFVPREWETIGRWESELEVRRMEDGLTNPVTWRYTPRRPWQDLEDRFAREDLGIMSATTLEDFA